MYWWVFVLGCFLGLAFWVDFFLECVLFCLFVVFVVVLFLTGLGYHLF